MIAAWLGTAGAQVYGLLYPLFVVSAASSKRYLIHGVWHRPLS